MRLLIATPLYPPELGGPATYTKILEEGLPREDSSWEVSVVKFSTVRKYPKLIRHVTYFLQVFRAAKHTDLVLVLDPVSVGLPASLAARLRGKKYIVKIVGDYAWEQGVQRFGITENLDDFVRRTHVPFRVQLFRTIQMYVATHATRVLVPSEYLKTIVGVWGIAASKIEVIYNAIELEEGGAVPQEVAALPRPLIVSAGRLVPWKGFESLLNAVSELPSAASVCIVGDGPDHTKLETYAREKLGARSVLTGPLSHKDTLAVIQSADIFVLNSSYEGLSHVLIEALMLGKPVIATTAGGNKELITHEENGLLIEAKQEDSTPNQLTQALTALLQSPDLATRLGSNAAKNSVRFSVPAMLAKTKTFFESI